MTSEDLWDHIVTEFGSSLSSTTFNALIGFGFYTFLCLVLTVLDLTGWAHQYKIQKDKQVTIKKLYDVLLQTVWAGIWNAVPIYFLSPFLSPMRNAHLHRSVPGYGAIFVQILVCWVAFDFGYWAWHLLHHRSKMLFNQVHAKHHEFFSPFSWVTQYVHPLELFATAVLSAGTPVFFGFHPLTCWIWMLFSIFISVDAHCGYDFPFSLHRWIPFYGGAKAHDFHHKKPTSNFEPFFSYLDLISGTAA